MRRGAGRLWRDRRGGVLVEYSVTVLVALLTLFATMEWGFEIFARQAAERAVTTASSVYAVTRSPERADAAMRASVGGLGARCLEEPEIRLFDMISGEDLVHPAAGRAPTGGADDDTARLARISVHCTWLRLTPIYTNFAGGSVAHSATAFVRIR